MADNNPNPGDERLFGPHNNRHGLVFRLRRAGDGFVLVNADAITPSPSPDPERLEEEEEEEEAQVEMEVGARVEPEEVGVEPAPAVPEEEEPPSPDLLADRAAEEVMAPVPEEEAVEEDELDNGWEWGDWSSDSDSQSSGYDTDLENRGRVQRQDENDLNSDYLITRLDYYMSIEKRSLEIYISNLEQSFRAISDECDDIRESIDRLSSVVNRHMMNGRNGDVNAIARSNIRQLLVFSLFQLYVNKINRYSRIQSDIRYHESVLQSVSLYLSMRGILP